MELRGWTRSPSRIQLLDSRLRKTGSSYPSINTWLHIFHWFNIFHKPKQIIFYLDTLWLFMYYRPFLIKNNGNQTSARTNCNDSIDSFYLLTASHPFFQKQILTAPFYQNIRVHYSQEHIFYFASSPFHWKWLQNFQKLRFIDLSYSFLRLFREPVELCWKQSALFRYQLNFLPPCFLKCNIFNEQQSGTNGEN